METVKFSTRFDDFDEEFTSEYNRQAHYQKHKKESPEWTEEEYEKQAEILAKKPVDNKRIFGYVSSGKDEKIAYAKWDKDTELFVVYSYKKDFPYIITAFKKSKREYESGKWDTVYGYVDEIPRGK